MKHKFAAVVLDDELLENQEDAEHAAVALLGAAVNWQTPEELRELAELLPDTIYVVKVVAKPALEEATLRDLLCPNGQAHLFLDEHAESALSQPYQRYALKKVR